VELGSGQSFMIAGLIQNNTTNNVEKAPGLGDVPILGNLFRSSNFRRGETELVIVVTPYLVKPVDDRDIRLPTDGFLAPNEAQRLLGNQIHGGQGGEARPAPSAVGNGPAAAPRVGAADTAPGASAATPPAQPRREEKVASATPGFSFK
jgi:pilus assembly protein CpaC